MASSSSTASSGLAMLPPLLLFAVVLADSAQGYVFFVGGRDGWVLNPSESYGHWAERNRFQVNDSIVFRYKKGEDSVLVVAKRDFNSCNVSHPIRRLDDGDSRFEFERSGWFFFVSGAPGRCEAGQKLVVVVMAVRRPRWPPVSAPPSVSPVPVPPPASSRPLLPPAATPSSETSAPVIPPAASAPAASPKTSARPAASPPIPTGEPQFPVLSPAPGPSESVVTAGAGVHSGKLTHRIATVVVGIMAFIGFVAN